LTALAFSLLIFSAVQAQDPPATRQEFNENYQQRIQQGQLYGVYIPKDVEDAFSTLNRLIDGASKKKFQNMSEADAATKLHFSLGRWIIRNWGFYEGSRLSHYIRIRYAIFHPDDAARFLIICYHRYLNGRPLEIKSLVETFHEKQKQRKLQRIEEGTIIHEETRQVNKG
jgi:hypothetical protein